MSKIILLLLFSILVIITVIADLYKRSIDGIPDPLTTRIETQVLSGKLRVGASAVDITPFLFSEKSSAIISIETEKIINPQASVTMDEDRKKDVLPKFINKFYLKSLVIRDKKSIYAFFSADLPNIKKAHLDTLYALLSRDFGLNSRFVQVFTPGLLCPLTLTPREFALNAEKCLKAALDNCQPAEYALIRASDPLIPSNMARIDIEGIGAMDVPPLCGPQTGKVYDATGPANRWIATLTPDTARLPPQSLFTRDAGMLPVSLLLFRSSPDHYIGGLVISPFSPFIAPPNAIRDYSADYITPLCTYLEKKMPGTFLFLRSPGADVVPAVDNFSYLNAQRFGTKIGALLFSGLKKAEWVRLKKAYGYAREVHPPMKEWMRLSKTDLIGLYEKYNRQSKSVREIGLDMTQKRELQDHYLSAFYLYRYLSDFGAPGPISVKILRLNSLLFLALPGSYLLKTDAAVRAPFKAGEFLLADNLDAYISALVPQENFNGGYLPNSSIFSDKAEAEMAEEARALARTVAPETPQ